MAAGETWVAGRTPRVIRQPVPGRRLQKVFMKGLRLPRRMVLPAIQAAKIAINPAQYRVRRRLAEEVAAGLDPAAAIDPAGGYRFFCQAAELPSPYCTLAQQARCLRLNRVPCPLHRLSSSSHSRCPGWSVSATYDARCWERTRRVRLTLGLGTRATSQAMKSSGSKTTRVVPSRHGVLS